MSVAKDLGVTYRAPRIAGVYDLTWRHKRHSGILVLQNRFELRAGQIVERIPIPETGGYRLQALLEGPFATAIDATLALIQLGAINCPTCQGRCRDTEDGWKETTAAHVGLA